MVRPGSVRRVNQPHFSEFDLSFDRQGLSHFACKKTLSGDGRFDLKRHTLLLAASVGFLLCSNVEAKWPTFKDKKSDSKSADGKSGGKFPTFEKVTDTVEKHFAQNRRYRQGDLLTTSMVESVFRKLEKINWKVSDRKDIQKMVLSDSDWMARQFSSDRGHEFMRQIADLPGGYDRVDRMRRMPYGQQQIAALIQGPDGSKLFEYMTTTQGGKNMGLMLSQGVNGEDFNQSTGRIYTELDLIKRLKKSYDREAVRRLKIEKGPEPKEQPGAKTKEPAPPVITPAQPKPQASDDPFE